MGVKPLMVNGYGVELALKRTDYIVIDDRAADEEQPGNDAADEGEKEKKEDDQVVLDDEEMNDLKPLTSSDLLGLGIKAASFITASQNPLATLVQVSQDFPKYSLAISKRNHSTDFMAEHRSNRDAFLPSGYNIVWMNGLQLEARQMDAFTLSEKFRRERSVIGSLRELGFTGHEAVRILSHPAIAESRAGDDSPRYDYRDTTEGGNVIIWLNDIEKDKRYEGWPTHVTAVR